MDDAIHAPHVHEAEHGPLATANFHETALNEVGGAQLLPQVSGEAEEGQQLRQIRFQLPHHAGIRRAPALAEARAPFTQANLPSLGEHLNLDNTSLKFYSDSVVRAWSEVKFGYYQ